MPSEINYRLIKDDEFKEVYSLIIRVFNECVSPYYTQQGINTFFGLISFDFFKLKNRDKFIIVAEYKKRVIGIISFIKKSHIGLLFLEKEFHGKGIGKKLIEEGINNCLLKNPDLKTITVNSSPYSLDFYQHVGFIQTSEEVNEKGMLFTPMQLSIK